MSSSESGRMDSPVFLIGTQRSGTTLLCRMLSAHPDIFIKNEVPVRSVFTPGASPEVITERISEYVKRTTGKPLDELLIAEDKSIWGLKDPELTAYLDALKQFRPNARFIVLVRDARAVVNSYMENKWGLGTNAYTGALRWRDEVESQLRFCEELAGEALMLRYEDLILDQNLTLNRICDFLGVSFDPSMLRHYDQTGYVRSTRENQNSARAPDPELVRKWKVQLTRHQIRVVDAICGPLLERLGYERASEPYDVPRWMVAYYHVHQRIIGELQIQYRWRLSQFRYRNGEPQVRPNGSQTK